MIPICVDGEGFAEEVIDEITPSIENIGWTLGNDCPYRCTHCYSILARKKGRDIEKWMVDRIVDQLASINVRTVNLGGNEPIFTNGIKVHDTQLPYIMSTLRDRGIVVGLTTAGITLKELREHHPEAVMLLNDVDISIDSPFKDEHDKNRGARLFDGALEAAHMCQELGIEHTLVMCGMAWNTSLPHIDELLRLAKETGSNIRINFLKPTEEKHLSMMPTPKQFYTVTEHLLARCTPLDLGESVIAPMTTGAQKGCPCGVKSFRINSITPDGRVPVSPCVYTHDYATGDLLTEELRDIIYSSAFRAFRRRVANPEQVEGCAGCEFLQMCRGGCAARGLLTAHSQIGLRSRDPYCLRDYREAVGKKEELRQSTTVARDRVLVHQDYLCTLIFEPL